MIGLRFVPLSPLSPLTLSVCRCFSEGAQHRAKKDRAQASSPARVQGADGAGSESALL
jgi:hypothetical protein